MSMSGARTVGSNRDCDAAGPAPGRSGRIGTIRSPAATLGHIRPVGFQSPRRFSCAAKPLTRLAQSAMQISGAESFAGAAITRRDVIEF